MSAAGIHYDHPSFDVFSETTAVNRKQAAAQNSCIKPDSGREVVPDNGLQKRP